MPEVSTDPRVEDPKSRGGVTGPQATLLRLAYGAQAAQVIYVAAKLSLADQLKDGARSSADLAGAAGVDAVILRRVLRCLASLGVLVETAPDRFGLTEMGQLLRSDRPDSLQPRAIWNTEVMRPLWGSLLHTLRTGESGAAHVLGMSLYDYLTAHPDIGALFDRTMAGYARYRLAPVVAAYDFSRFGSIVDVGGGNGALLIEILRGYPQPRGIVFDLPPVAERARQNIATAGLSDRCIAVGGGALETVPAGGDAYVLSNFLIGMSDEEAIQILRHCRRGMSAGGRVLLIEWVVPTGAELASGSFKAWDTTSIDLTILSTGAGRVRTADEFEAVLHAAGLTTMEIVPTASSVSVIEAGSAHQ
jgi:precorrin-6B methylase 2